MDQYSTYKNNKIMMSQITQINLLGLLVLLGPVFFIKLSVSTFNLHLFIAVIFS
jgi:hypothetical protein